MTHCKNGTWSNFTSMHVHDNASTRMTYLEMEQDTLIPTEQENTIFQDTYKEITGCKTSKPHVHGYLAKYPTRRELMNAQTEEAARVSAAAQERNIELEGRVKELEQQLANEATERERILEEKTRQIQEEEKKAREELKDQLMEQMASLIAKEREETTQKANQDSTMLEDNVQVCKTGTSKVPQKNNAYISPHQLRSVAAASKLRARPREDAM